MDMAPIGHLYITSVRNPETWDISSPSHEGVKDLGLVLDGSEWGESMLDELHGDISLDDLPDLAQVGGDEYNRVRLERLRRSIPNYPMLARIYDMYDDAIYPSADLPLLRDECVTLTSKIHNRWALEMVETLITACDLASADGWGLFLMCD